MSCIPQLSLQCPHSPRSFLCPSCIWLSTRTNCGDTLRPLLAADISEMALVMDVSREASVESNRITVKEQFNCLNSKQVVSKCCAKMPKRGLI